MGEGDFRSSPAGMEYEHRTDFPLHPVSRGGTPWGLVASLGRVRDWCLDPTPPWSGIPLGNPFYGRRSTPSLWKLPLFLTSAEDASRPNSKVEEPSGRSCTLDSLGRTRGVYEWVLHECMCVTDTTKLLP